MIDIENEILLLINEEIAKLTDIQATLENIQTPDDIKYGDLSTNIALILSKNLKQNPIEIAEKLANRLKESPYINSVEVVKPGFINLFINNKIYIDNLDEIIRLEKDYGKSNEGNNKRVTIDYSAPNIAKSFGIGHLRSTIIGQAIYNLYKYMGWECVGDNHLGDWGTQFGMIIAAIQKDKLNIDGMTIKDLETVYVNFNKQIESEPTLKDLAREAFAKLEAKDIEATRIWQKAIEISMLEFEKIYDKLEVKIDYAYGESSYSELMKDVIKECREKGLTKISEGAEIIEFKDLPPAILIKSNKTTTYLTRDLATIKFRENNKDLKANLYVYEVGVEQTLHFRQVFEIAKMLGWGEDAQFVHVGHGLMRLPQGEKMSTRKGNTIKLEQLLFEADKKATEIMKDKQGDNLETDLINSAKDIGIGAIKYNDLKRLPATDYIFTWEDALAMDGNSAPYIQYTHRRSKSVLEKANLKMQEDKEIALSKEELEISKLLYVFNKEISISAKSFSPNKLAAYLYKLAKLFNSYYASNRILGTKNETLKLKLCFGVSQVIENGLGILGIKTVSIM